MALEPVFPLKVEENLVLPSLGVSIPANAHSYVLPSNKWACVQQSGDQVTLVDLLAKTKNVLSVNCDAALLRGDGKLIALRSGRILQIFDLAKQSRIKHSEMREDAVILWKWISHDWIAIVTEQAAYHWSISPEKGHPELIMSKNETLASLVITNYCTDNFQQWCMLLAISLETGIGTGQLFSVQQKKFQILNAEAATFFSYESRELIALMARQKLSILPLKNSKPEATPFERMVTEMVASPFPTDTAVAIQVDEKRGILFVVLKSGIVAVHDARNAAALCTIRTPVSSMLAVALNDPEGILILDKTGVIYQVELRYQSLVSYLLAQSNEDKALELAIRLQLPGNEGLFIQKFQQLFDLGNYEAAGKLAAEAPNFVLRTNQIWEKLSPLSAAVKIYFATILSKSRLLDWEAVQLCSRVIQNGRSDLIENWLRDNRLECSYALGNLFLANNNPTLALSTFLRVDGCPHKVVACMVQLGKIDQLFQYCDKVQFQPDFAQLVAQSPEYAVEIATKAQEKNVLAITDTEKIADTLIARNLAKECLAFLGKCVKTNTAEVGNLQTKFLSICLDTAPHQADAILVSNTLSHFDRHFIATICEQRGLLHHALKIFTENHDWQRILARAPEIPFLHLISFFEKVPVDHIPECLTTIFTSGQSSLAVKLAIRCRQRTPVATLIGLFEKFQELDGLFTFLSCLVLESDDSDIHYRYVSTAMKLGRFREAESLLQNSEHLDVLRLKNLLMDPKTPDFGPLLVLCNRFQLVKDFVLFAKNIGAPETLLGRFVQMNPFRLPQVLDSCLSLDADEASVKHVISLCDEEVAGGVVDVANCHGRLSILQPWLEELVTKGSENTVVHTTLAKIKIISGSGAEKYLEENQFYDAQLIGNFCENLCPELAIAAFTRGNCSDDLIRFCFKSGFLKQLGLYLIKRCDLDLWIKALTTEQNKGSLAETVINLVSVDTPLSEAITVIVKAFVSAELNVELLQLMETLIFDCPGFEQNSQSQNYLILLAVKHAPQKVQQYLEELRDYDAYEIAIILRQSGLYHEAVTAYEKCNALDDAINVILNDLHDLDFAKARAEKYDSPSVWAKLLAEDVELGIDALIRANDAVFHLDVIQAAAENQRLWGKLICYLENARNVTHNRSIDNQLLLTYAKSGELEKLKAMVATSSHYADIKEVAELCYDEKLFDAAWILFESIGCYTRVAQVYAEIDKIPEAIASARKGASLDTWWKLCQVSFSKADVESILATAQHLFAALYKVQEIVSLFESNGMQDEGITLLTSVVQDEPSPILLTDLALLTIRHKHEAFLEFMRKWEGRFQVVRILNALKEFHLWRELAVLLESHGDSLEAVNVMLSHPTEAWDHDRFKRLLSKVISSQLIQPVISFYLAYKPMLLNDLLASLTPRIDLNRVVGVLSTEKRISFAKDYLVSRINDDNRAVNAALCEIYIQEENWTELTNLVTTQNTIDVAGLAERLENHDVMGFRRVSVLLYEKSRKYGDALRVCKNNGFQRAAIQVATESQDRKIVEELLRGFLEQGKKEFFAVALYNCYELVTPDLVLELSLLYDVWHFSMPYLIQFVSEFFTS